MKGIEKFHKYMCKLHGLNQNSFDYNEKIADLTQKLKQIEKEEQETGEISKEKGA